MTSLTAQLVQAGRAERGEAWTDYRLITRRADAANDGDGARIIEVCDLLDIPLDQMERDSAAWRQMPVLVERAAERDVLEKQRLKLQAEQQKCESELKKWILEKDQMLRDIRRDVSSVVHKLTIAESAAVQAESLRATHWRVFEGASPAPATVPGVGTMHPQEVDAWLAAQPPVLAYVHDGERSVVSAIRAAGYVPGEPGQWVRKETK